MRGCAPNKVNRNIKYFIHAMLFMLVKILYKLHILNVLNVKKVITAYYGNNMRIPEKGVLLHMISPT